MTALTSLLVGLLLSSQALAISDGRDAGASSKQVAQSTAWLQILGMDGSAKTCTGTLIAPHFILTAGHCLTPFPRNIHIVFAPPRGGFFIANAVGSFVHESFIPSVGLGSRNDIALVYFDEKLPAGIIPAEILESEKFLKTLYEQERVTIAGFGQTSPFESDTGALRIAELAVTGWVGELVRVEDLLGHSSACGGDSGGPAFIKRGKKLLYWGILSFTANDPTCARESYYTAIWPHLPWIHSTMATILDTVATMPLPKKQR